MLKQRNIWHYICSHNSLLVPLSPVAFYPLNGQYETADVSHNMNSPAEAANVTLAPGPDGSKGARISSGGK